MTEMRKRICLLLLACLFACSALPALGASSEKPLLGDFTTVNLDLEAVDTSLFLEYPVNMINMWATYCPPCLNEMPDLGKIAAEYADKGVQIIGLVLDVTDQQLAPVESQMELAREIVQATGAAYPHILPTMEMVQSVLHAVTAVPTTVFVDAQGRLLGQAVIGSRSYEQWTELLDALLLEAAP